MELPAAIVDLLRDETYVIRGRAAAEAALAEWDVQQDHPPNGRGAAPELRGAAGSWYLAPPSPPTEGEQWEGRLRRLERLEAWLGRRIRAGLEAHLDARDPDHLRLGRILRLVNEWEFCVRRLLTDTLASFLRQLRAVRTAAAVAEVTTEALLPLLSRLRDVATRLEDRDAQLNQIAAAVAGYSQSIAAARVSLPMLPNFRRVLWINWLMVKTVPEIRSESEHVDRALQAFLDTGIEPALARAQAARAVCVTYRENRLRELWAHGRAALKLPDVSPELVDQILTQLTDRYAAAMAAESGGGTSDPFLAPHR